MKRAHSVLLAAWIIGLGADRLNLLEGVMPVVFTPFLALTPLVIVSEWIRRSMTGSSVVVSRAALQYAGVGVALLGIVWASVALAQGGTESAMRASLLTAQVVGTWTVLVLASDRDDFLALLGRAGTVGIALHAIASIAELAALFRELPLTLRAGTVTLSLRIDAYAGIVPRLTGLVADPTRAGWALLVLASFAAVGERRPALRRFTLALASASVAMTLSRSAFLAAAVMLILVALTRRRLQLSAGSLVSTSVVFALLAGLLFAFPDESADRFRVLEPLAGRFSGSEASASEHVLLIGRGLEEATSSTRRFAIGLGYGNSFLVLQDRFPGNPYGNFHSLYVALLAESGIFALLCLAVLMGRPLARDGTWRPLVAGAAVLNVFYQTNAEPSFWMVLALAWMFSEIPGTTRQQKG